MTKKTNKPFLPLVGEAVILKSIKAIGTSGKKLEALIHLTAVSVLMHIEKHGDVTLANSLIEAVPSIARKNALRDWLIAFGKLDYSKERGGMVYAKGKTTNSTEAIAKPFWEFKPEAAYVPFNAETFLNSAVKRMQTAKDRGDDVPDMLFDAMKALQGKLIKQDALAA